MTNTVHLHCQVFSGQCCLVRPVLTLILVKLHIFSAYSVIFSWVELLLVEVVLLITRREPFKENCKSDCSFRLFWDESRLNTSILKVTSHQHIPHHIPVLAKHRPSPVIIIYHHRGYSLCVYSRCLGSGYCLKMSQTH